MKIVKWLIQVLLAFAFIAAGLMKLTTPYAELVEAPGMAWAGGFSGWQIQAISILEILGAIGVIVPMFVDKIKFLVPLAAIGLAALMVGAIATHIGRGESILTNVILMTLGLLTAWFRKDLLVKSEV